MDAGLMVRRCPGMTKASHLLLPGGRLALLQPLLLFRAVAAVEAAGGGAEHAVMARIVTGDAADHGTFQAALGVGRRGRRQRERGDGEKCGERFHDASSPGSVRVVNGRRGLGFRSAPATVIVRLDRTTQYPRGGRYESRSRAVLGAPVKPGHDD